MNDMNDNDNLVLNVFVASTLFLHCVRQYKLLYNERRHKHGQRAKQHAGELSKQQQYARRRV
jgi:hypothetical protein